MNAKERILKVQEYSGISGRALAAYCGLKEDDLKSIRVGKTANVSRKVAEAVVKNFPQINKLWLLTGEGEMLVTDDHVTLQMNIPKGGDSVNVNELLAIIHTQQTQNNELREENKVLQGKFDALVEKMSSVTDELAKQRTIMMKIIMKEDVKDDTTKWYSPDIASEPKTKE